MIISSLQVGKPAMRNHGDAQVETAVFKQMVEGPLLLSRDGFADDAVADKVHHGGPDKAVLVYCAAHDPHWRELLGRDPGHAAFGENITVDGATEETVCIGDTYRLGEALVQVSQPRVPCFKMNVRQGRGDILPEMVRTGFTGFYLRVLEEGQVRAGDAFERLHRPEGAPTVAFANRLRHLDRDNRDGLVRLLQAEGLAQVWVDWLQSKLG